MSILDPLAYPAPRADRDVPTSFTQQPTSAATLTVPSARVVSWAFNAGGNTRATACSPKLRGPAIIKSVYYELDTGSDPPGPSFELGYASILTSEVNVSLSLAKPYTPIGVRMTGATQVGNTSLTGFIHWSLYNVRTRHSYPLNFVVTQPEWFLTASLLNTIGFAAQCVGFAEVIEGVSSQALANFL